MVSVSVSSLQVAVNIHYNNCIVGILKMCHKEVWFFFSSNASRNEMCLSSRVHVSVSQNAAI